MTVESDVEAIAKGLTKAQRRLVKNMDCFFAALREPGDFMADGNVFSEKVGIIVHPLGGGQEGRYRVRNKTAGPLYLASPPLVDCVGGDSGFRCFSHTPMGLAVRSFLASKAQPHDR